MRRRNREINIFSMSALDLFASAMGAFVLITLILMPYYLNRPGPHLLGVEIMWTSHTDVDLYVITPHGEYSYKKEKIGKSLDIFLLDNKVDMYSKDNPAREFWLSPNPEIGDYTVCYKYFEGDPVLVSGNLFKLKGIYKIKDRKLNVLKKKDCFLTFSVNSENEVINIKEN